MSHVRSVVIRALAAMCLLAMAFSCEARDESTAPQDSTLGTGGALGTGGMNNTNAGPSGAGGGAALTANGTGGMLDSGGNGGTQAARIDSGAANTSSVGQPMDATFDAGVAPVVLCSPTLPDAAIETQGASPDSGAPPRDDTCAPPPSRCLDQDRLLYYTGGTCQDGRCTWVKEIMMCPRLCVASGCDVGFTA